MGKIHLGSACTTDEECVGNAVCHLSERLCFERCENTPFRDASTIPHADFRCDYGNDRPLAVGSVDTTVGRRPSLSTSSIATNRSLTQQLFQVCGVESGHRQEDFEAHEDLDFARVVRRVDRMLIRNPQLQAVLADTWAIPSVQPDVLNFAISTMCSDDDAAVKTIQSLSHNRALSCGVHAHKWMEDVSTRVPEWSVNRKCVASALLAVDLAHAHSIEQCGHDSLFTSNRCHRVGRSGELKDVSTSSDRGVPSVAKNSLRIESTLAAPISPKIRPPPLPVQSAAPGRPKPIVPTVGPASMYRIRTSFPGSLPFPTGPGIDREIEEEATEDEVLNKVPPPLLTAAGELDILTRIGGEAEDRIRCADGDVRREMQGSYEDCIIDRDADVCRRMIETTMMQNFSKCPDPEDLRSRSEKVHDVIEDARSVGLSEKEIDAYIIANL